MASNVMTKTSLNTESVGNNKQSFVDLVNELYTENRELSLNKLVDLFVNRSELVDLLVNECKTDERSISQINLEFINQLINLPRITANIFQLLNHKQFKPDTYYDDLCSIIYESLTVIQ